MLFNSLHFVLFFIVVTSAYHLLPHRYRWQLLLAGSCYFYMAFVPVYILILGFTIVIDYFAGLYIEKTRGQTRRLFLIISLISNIGVLAIFKYYNFLNDNLNLMLANVGYPALLPPLTILLPIGLSFHTFQAMSYIIEVYRGNQKAERHFGIYSLYVMFYPQLVAGPIERPQNILHQFYEKHEFDARQVVEGLKQIAWGLFKKVVIADRLAVIVNYVYNDPTQFQGFPLIIATVLFAFQIYCDFSGYSDIALGTARTIGFRLMKNFDRPYLSTSVSEFWKRWHISLSTWFRDYLYIPLGGNRVAVPRWYLNLFITFLVSGLWHGASWTYVIWGSLNGLYLIIESMTKNTRHRLSQRLGLQHWPSVQHFLNLTTTFGLICFAWIFFRAQTVGDAFYVVTHLFSDLRNSLSEVIATNLGSDKYNLFIGGLALVILLLVETLQGRISLRHWIGQQPTPVRMTLYYALIMFIILFGVFDARQQFIYFQF
ncbi:MBOAT family O-acyltransferase [Tellurirhabdus bombi]|uniref:MBOAT family O-acyltransferase n=1 Tax=Tellurirhabdus bombi TaxID=2907205 RepID=UPI001F47B233|nr:MBOAT family O-acyltransferase [Tellurirhabdus bombi]